MNAQGPPNMPPRVNPLMRPSDRFEWWFGRFLIFLLVLGLSVAAYNAGMTAYGASMHTVRAQAADRHEVTARLTADVERGEQRGEAAGPGPMDRRGRRRADRSRPGEAGNVQGHRGARVGGPGRSRHQPAGERAQREDHRVADGLWGGIRYGHRVLRTLGGHTSAAGSPKVRAVGCRVGPDGAAMVRALPPVMDSDREQRTEEAAPMSDATTTDLHEVTMAMSYLREGMTAPAAFSLFVRDLPPERGFLIAAGLEPPWNTSPASASAPRTSTPSPARCTGRREIWSRSSAWSSPAGCGRYRKVGSCLRASHCWR